MQIKLLTFNIGLLDYKILGKIIFSNPKYSKERLLYIPSLLLKSDSDIICLQECYDLSHFKFIYRKIKNKYPYFARKNFNNKLFKLHNGLIIFSKFKIQNTNLFKHNNSDIVEKLFGNKSFLVAEIVINNYNLVIFNTHLTSGILPSSQLSIYNRQTQLDEIFSISNYYLNKGFIPLILGDLNFGPKTKVNYDYIINNGYVDSYSIAEINNNINYTYSSAPLYSSMGALYNKIKYTWSQNMLNTVHNNEIEDRLDHLFFHKQFEKQLNVNKAEIVFFEKNIKIINNNNIDYCTASDHFGLLVELILDY